MDFKILLILSISTINFGKRASANQDNPVVHTSLGSVQGEFVTTYAEDVTNKVYRFLGIPYAQPPVGELRFKKPEPVKPWTGTYQATKNPNICVQSIKAWEQWNTSPGGEPSEDCLYLNVWTPELPKEGQNPKKPVMVFIHGGGFKLGSASQPVYDGSYIASYGDVVLVTINYRLSILGFLNLGTEDIPGNQGLWDQRQALKWIREHIEHFGGDPGQVTVFGESAGSLSTGAHLLSPSSQGLFQRAIMQSGSPINPVFLYTLEEAVGTALKFAKHQGCSKQSEEDKHEVTPDLINCVKHLDIAKLMEVEEENYNDIKMPHALPTYGDEFLPKNDEQHMTELDRDPVDLMIGIVANEGSFFALRKIMEMTAGENAPKPFTVDDAKAVTKALLPSVTSSLLNEVLNSYFDHVAKDTLEDTLKQIVSFVFGDYLLACPTAYFAEYFSRNNPVYFYHFNHSSGFFPEWTGVNHGEDILYLFRRFIFPKNLTEDELEFSRHLVKLWTTFAKTGKPQLSGVETWPMYSENRPMVMDLKPKDFTVDIDPRLKACNFWRCHLQRP